VVPDPPFAVSVLLAPEQIVAGFADADVGAVGWVQPPAIVIASKQPALFTVVTAVSRKMVIDVPVAVTLPVKYVKLLPLLVAR
jgi:hypothetical protein